MCSVVSKILRSQNIALALCYLINDDGRMSVGGGVGGLVLIKCLGGVVTRKRQKAWLFMVRAEAS